MAPPVITKDAPRIVLRCYAKLEAHNLHNGFQRGMANTEKGAPSLKSQPWVFWCRIARCGRVTPGPHGQTLLWTYKPLLPKGN